MPLVVLLRDPKIFCCLPPLIEAEAAEIERESKAVTLGRLKGSVLMVLQLGILMSLW